MEAPCFTVQCHVGRQVHMRQRCDARSFCFFFRVRRVCDLKKINALVAFAMSPCITVSCVERLLGGRTSSPYFFTVPQLLSTQCSLCALRVWPETSSTRECCCAFRFNFCSLLFGLYRFYEAKQRRNAEAAGGRRTRKRSPGGWLSARVRYKSASVRTFLRATTRQRPAPRCARTRRT